MLERLRKQAHLNLSRAVGIKSKCKSQFIIRLIVFQVNADIPRRFYTSVVDGELLDRAANTQENQDGEEEERQPTLVMAALRVGCAPQIVPQQAITEAINIAIKCDAVIAMIGTNMDIEGEGGDRPNLELPGLTNEFIQKLLSARPDTIIVNQSVSTIY